LTAPVLTDDDREYLAALKRKVAEAALWWVYDKECASALAAFEQAADTYMDTLRRVRDKKIDA
jgi:D-serine deaminase-like pyridoxal phosphate-dependent protein